MTYDVPPRNLASLNQRMRNQWGDEALILRRRTTMALVVVGQMLPEGAVKGGSAMALRYGAETRFTRDLDAARVNDLATFRSEFEDRLQEGWSGFNGRLVERKPPTPAGVPTAYVMQPFDVKLEYLGQPWCTITFELGHNEIGDANDPELVLAPGIAELFAQVGLPAPAPVPVMPADHQIAQKLHACTTAGSDRARDLVDLQLLSTHETLDLSEVRATCVRLFEYRRAHTWPPTVEPGVDWVTLYAEASAGLEVAETLDAAIAHVNAFIAQIDSTAEEEASAGDSLAATV